MKKALRLHVGLMIAKALYASRDQHLADLQRLRSGLDETGKELSLQDKLHIVDTMMTRMGRDTAGLWVPASVLAGLESLWDSHRAKAKTEEKKDEV